MRESCSIDCARLRHSDEERYSKSDSTTHTTRLSATSKAS